MRKNSYTEEEDRILKECIENEPSVSMALRKASELLHRSPEACRQRYKYILKKQGKSIPPAKRHFTEEEDEVIINHLKDTPTNIQEGLRRASVELKRSHETIEQRYYKILRNDPKYLALTCGSKKGLTHNVKNVHRDKKTGELPDQNLRHYMVIMKQLLELSPKERKKILGFFEE